MAMWQSWRADAVVMDVRFAWRRLARDRSFTLTAVLVLGLGIGVNNMLFTILNAHTLRGLPMPEVTRVLYVSTIDDRGVDRGLSHPDFEDLRVSAQHLSGLVAFAGAPVTVGDTGQAPERVEGTYVTAAGFAVAGVEPLMGRAFTSADDRRDAPLVVMLGQGLWRSRYAEDEGVQARSIFVNAEPATVIGIVPSRSGFPSTAEIWLPLAKLPGLAFEKRDARTLRVFGRLRDGSNAPEGRAEIEGIAARLASDHPLTNRGVRARVMPINERFLGRLTDPAWLAFLTVGFLIVVISSANVANLVLDAAVHRRRELAIRSSLGASRGRIVRHLLIEAGTLAALGALVGFGLSAAGVRLFRTAVPANLLPYWLDYSIDARVLAALVGVSFATVFVFGLAPAVSASKTDVTQTLKPAGGGVRRGAQRLSVAFLAVEIALTVVMLANVALSMRIARPPVASDAQIHTTDVLTASIVLSGDRYRTPAQRMDLYRRLEERLTTIPGVTSAALASALPLQGALERRLEIAGRPHAGDAAPAVFTTSISPRYFETLGLALIGGRDLSSTDGTASQPSAIVNERFVKLHFGGENPIGRNIALRLPEGGGAAVDWLTIVGVAPDIRHFARPDPDPVVYLPYRSTAPPAAVLLVRSRSDSTPLAALLKEEMRVLDSNTPLYRIQTMARAMDDAEWNRRVSARLLIVLTCIALGLSSVGLYAVTSHGVSQRTGEIGLRMALGARPGQVRQLILRRAAAQVVVGFVVGVGCTVLWDRVFGGTRDARGVADPQSLAIVAAVLAVIVLVACLVPVRRATRLNPVAAIRSAD